MRKIREEIRRVRNGKATGIDGIPEEVGSMGEEELS